MPPVTSTRLVTLGTDKVSGLPGVHSEVNDGEILLMSLWEWKQKASLRSTKKSLCVVITSRV